MKLTIKQFTFSALFLLLVGMYSVFTNYYFNQREITATVIMNTITNDLSELSYILSKHVKKESITTARALIDRKAANNNYLSAIAIFDDKELIITTDPKHSKNLTTSELYVSPYEDTYTFLLEKAAVDKSIRYYQGKALRHYTLLFFIDKDVIENVFIQAREKFILLFVFIPIIFLGILWFAIRKLVESPLETLRQYAYYHAQIPNAFKIKEIEYIRSSMVQTFTRLEQEKKELYNISRTDSLSGLSNRSHLQERVEQIIASSKRDSGEFALLFLDLDHFKSINDSLGHDIGDELLKSVAKTIQQVLRMNDEVARIGGDEFVIVLTQYKDEIELYEIIERIQAQIMKPWQIKTYPINITSSIGVTIYPKDGTDLLTLMKNADIAMYEAKARGRQGYHFFTESLNIKTQEYIKLTNAMREAMQKNHFELYFQPQNNTQTNEITGAEALIRWNDSEKGFIPPSVFIPIAEHNGDIVELGKWILETSIKQLKVWQDEGLNINISINVAAQQIQQDDFVSYLKMLLERYRVNRNKIHLEITEYVFLNNSASVVNTFTAIKKLGVQISLDDFGTGYSSLSYLKDFPIDILKIDKSFLNDYDNEEGAIFIQTIVNMAHTLNLQVVAEGVESQSQVEYLRSIKCDSYQGYVTSRPVQIDVFNKLFKRQGLKI